MILENGLKRIHTFDEVWHKTNHNKCFWKWSSWPCGWFGLEKTQFICWTIHVPGCCACSVLFAGLPCAWPSGCSNTKSCMLRPKQHIAHIGKQLNLYPNWLLPFLAQRDLFSICACLDHSFWCQKVFSFSSVARGAVCPMVTRCCRFHKFKDPLRFGTRGITAHDFWLIKVTGPKKFCRILYFSTCLLAALEGAWRSGCFNSNVHVGARINRKIQQNEEKFQPFERTISFLGIQLTIDFVKAFGFNATIWVESDIFVMVEWQEWQSFSSRAGSINERAFRFTFHLWGPRYCAWVLLFVFFVASGPFCCLGMQKIFLLPWLSHCHNEGNRSKKRQDFQQQANSEERKTNWIGYETSMLQKINEFDFPEGEKNTIDQQILQKINDHIERK